jgi:hypothetical protein
MQIMKTRVIAVALFSLISATAMAGSITTSGSSSSSGGQTSASVSGFGSFRATDYGTANGNAQAIAGSGFNVTGNATNATTSHNNTSTAGGYGHGTSSSAGIAGADAAARAWSSLGRGWR